MDWGTWWIIRMFVPFLLFAWCALPRNGLMWNCPARHRNRLVWTYQWGRPMKKRNKRGRDSDVSQWWVDSQKYSVDARDVVGRMFILLCCRCKFGRWCLHWYQVIPASLWPFIQLWPRLPADTWWMTCALMLVAVFYQAAVQSQKWLELSAMDWVDWLALAEAIM